MKLSTSAIGAIEKTLESGGICEVSSAQHSIIVRHYPERRDIDLHFPIMIRADNCKMLIISSDDGEVRTDLCHMYLPSDYWLCGIKGTPKTIGGKE